MAKVKQQDEATPEIENAVTTDTVEVSEEITEPTDTVEGTTEAKAEQPTHLYTDLSEDDRIAKLKETADKISNRTYQRDMTSCELSKLKDRHTKVAIKLYDLERKKKSFNDSINSQIKPVKEECDDLVSDLKRGTTSTNGTCYEFINSAECKVYIYSEGGILVDTREPTDKEQEQISMKFIKDSEAADADTPDENEVEELEELEDETNEVEDD